MPEYLRLCGASDLPEEDEVKECTLGDRVFCVANIGGRYFALDNVCAHRGGPLGQGIVVQGKVVCPWHGWMYDVQTGVPDIDPNCRVAVHELQISGDDVLIAV